MSSPGGGLGVFPGRPATGKARGTSLLISPAPQTHKRATVTCDTHGVVVSCNAAVFDVFGKEPEDVVDRSCQEMLQLLTKERKQGRLVVSERQELRFSRTDMWQDLMKDLTSVRVVNGRHADGTLTPLLLTSSEVKVGGVRLYALLFEPLRHNSAIVTTDMDGVIQSASENIHLLLSLRARSLCGTPLSRYCQDATIDYVQRSLDASQSSKFGQQAKNIVGAPVPVTLVNGAGVVTAVLQVLDVRNNMYVVALKREDAASSAAGTSATSPVKPKLDEAKLKILGFNPDADDKEEEVGYYTVKGGLGVGQCGQVRKGTHRTTGTAVAVKTLTKANFLEIGLRWPGRELDLMRFLNHSNIVQLFDCVHGVDCMYLIMEIITGGELLSFCFNAGPLPESQARAFFRDILGAVDYLHRKGIVHRDLKLENCLLDKDGRVKIIDFGLGNFYLKGPLKTSCGSADYAAPELFTTSMYFGPPVDVWAIGVMLFAMVSGEFPFEDIQATLEGSYEFPAKVRPTPQLARLLGFVFEVNPDLRLTIEQIRRHDWVNTGYKAPPARPAIATDTPGASGRARAPSAEDGVVKRDVFKIRSDILWLMEVEHGFLVSAVIESLLSEEINQYTATYKMLLHKHPGRVPITPQDEAREKAIADIVTEAERLRAVGGALDLPAMRARSRTGTSAGDGALQLPLPGPNKRLPRPNSAIFATLPGVDVTEAAGDAGINYNNSNHSVSARGRKKTSSSEHDEPERAYPFGTTAAQARKGSDSSVDSSKTSLSGGAAQALWNYTARSAHEAAVPAHDESPPSEESATSAPARSVSAPGSATAQARKPNLKLGAQRTSQINMGCKQSSLESPESREIDKFLKKDAKLHDREIKLLLLGAGDSGKSTLAKQMKVLFLNGFTDPELRSFAPILRQNLMDNTALILRKGAEWGVDFGELQPIVSRWNATRPEEVVTEQHLSDFRVLFASPAFLDVANRGAEFGLSDNAFYIMERAEEISKESYMPSVPDMMQMRIITTCVTETVFDYEDLNFRMVDVGGQRNERRKWLHCLADDHEVLTERGFLAAQQVRGAMESASADGEPLRIVGFDVQLQQLVLERPSGFVWHAAMAQPMVSLRSDSGVDLLVTPEHDLLVQRPPQSPVDVKRARGADYRKFKAAALLSGDAPFVRMRTSAPNGLRVSAAIGECALVEALELDSNARLMAFAWLYGCWIAGGSVIERDAIVFGVEAASSQYASAQFEAAGVARSHVYRRVDGALLCRDGRWVGAFRSYLCGDAIAWPLPWKGGCPVPVMRELVRGVSGGSGGAETGCVRAASRALRDAVMQLCLFSGFAAHFECAVDESCWLVHYSNTAAVSQPTLQLPRDAVAQDGYAGATWCVTMPSGHLVARRVLEREHNTGVVLRASTPVLVGNCFNHVTAIIFVASLSEYDQMLVEDNRVNRMHESLKLFDEMVNCTWFATTPVILFLNKADLLRRKLERGIYPSKLFSEYKGGDNFDEAVAFLQRKFLSLSKRPKEQAIHAFVTTATDEKNVRTIFALCKGIILKDVLDEAF